MLYYGGMKVSVSGIGAVIQGFLQKKQRLGPFLAILTGFVLAAVVVTTSQAYADQPYNSGTYGDCAYSQGCDPPPPTTVVPVPPSHENPQSGRAFSVNITEGQKFKGDSYDVVVTPNFSVDQIESVELYVNGQLVGTSNSADNGVFVVPWQLPKKGSYTVRVVIHLRDGGTIEKTFAVHVSGEADTTTKPGTSNSATNPLVQSVEGQSFLRRLFHPVATLLQKIANATPRPLAYAMPYVVLVLLGALLLTLLYQTRNQLLYIAALLKLLERDKQLADEKANFIMLASHYIRTPLTVLSGTIDLALMDHSDDSLLAESKTAVDTLHARAEQILNDVEHDKDLQNITAPDIGLARSRLYHSFSLLSPIVLSALLIVAMNALYLSARRIELVVPNIVAQLLLFVVLSVFLYSLIKRRAQQKEQRQRLEQQRDYEEALDHARNQFIDRSAQELTPLVNQLKTSFAASADLHESPPITTALGQLEVLLYRFVLVTELERGKIRRSLSAFDFASVASNTLAEFHDIITAKKLQVREQFSGLELQQSQLLLQYVLRIVLDNAVKFSPETGRVTVSTAAQGRKGAAFTVRNPGQVIDPAALERLFRPFSRNGSAEVFNEGGAGLSLYLARLIMRYLGGDVELTAETAKATTARVSLPRIIEI